MRDFCIVNKEDNSQAILRVDIISDDFNKFTVMWMSGVKGTKFESILPWHQGSVVSMSEIEEWAQNNSSDYSVYKFGGEQIVLVGSTVHSITINPTIVGASKATITMTGTYEGMPPISDTFEIENSVEKKVNGINGYNYNFTIVTENASWTSSSPEEFECVEDKTVDLNITVTEE